MARRAPRETTPETGETDDFAPRKTAGLAGQENAERILLEGFTSGRLAHSWLLHGPKGIGKATLAYRFARFVLAHGGASEPNDAARDTLAISPNDPVYRRVATAAHADMVSVERGWDDKRKRIRDEIIVADVRSLASFFTMTPAEGGWRIAIVDAADEMNRNAANALLKILEEPPKKGLLILVSHAPGRLLPTIRSRCRKLALQPLSPDIIATLLAEQAPDVTAADRAILAILADGSGGRALAMAKHGGLEVFRELIAILSRLPDLDIAALHQLGDRLARRGAGDSYALFTQLFVWWFARFIRHSASHVAMPTLVPGEDALVQHLAQRGDLEQWVDVWDKVSSFFSRAETANLDKKQVILIAFAALSDAAKGKSITLPG